MVVSPLKTEGAELDWRQEDGDVSFRRKGLRCLRDFFPILFY